MQIFNQKEQASGIENGVLNPKPKLLGFHMPGLSTLPPQIKRHSERQKKGTLWEKTK
jgi:hypothetical protein